MVGDRPIDGPIGPAGLQKWVNAFVREVADQLRLHLEFDQVPIDLQIVDQNDGQATISITAGADAIDRLHQQLETIIGKQSQ